MGLFDDIGDAFKNAGNTIWNGIDTAAGTVVQAVQVGATHVVDGTLQVWNGTTWVTEQAWNTIKEAGGHTIDTLSGGELDAFKAVENAFATRRH